MYASTDISVLQGRIALYEDMKAYEALYERLAPRLQRFSYSLVRSREAAEEVVSDVFIKLWQIRNTLDRVDNLQVYLYTITKNFSLNYITRTYKNPVVSLDEMEVEPVIRLGNPEELYLSAEVIDGVRQAIRQLPPQCRLVFQLVKEDGLSYKEVAEILHLSVLTVRNQLAIAVRKMAEALPAFREGDGARSVAKPK